MQEKFCPSLAFYAKGIFVGQMFRKKIDCLSEEKVALPIYIQHATHLGNNHAVRFKNLVKMRAKECAFRYLTNEKTKHSKMKNLVTHPDYVQSL